mgnify:CR=1 FL=1
MLECLRLGKKVIGVINERLMDNHQLEILDALEKDSYMLGFRTMAEVDTGVNKLRGVFVSNIE